MIVVGVLGRRDSTGAVDPMPLEIARRATSGGARTELIGVAPANVDGDRRLLELAAAGVGHATVIRTGADGIEPADLDLALRYLPDVRAIVLVRPDPGLIPIAIAAAGWSGAALVFVGPLGQQDLDQLDAETNRPLVLDPPSSDPDGAFAVLVASLAVHLEAGGTPEAAWRSTLRALAVDPQ